MKRLVIYFHYDPQGVVDEPCRTAVAAMQQVGKVFFVTNGTLDRNARMWLQQTGVDLLERDNVGYDVGAYRAALQKLGRSHLDDYDELILMNYTLAGPVCPLLPMFATMEARTELAFWGLTRHYAMRSRRFGGNVPEHLQSHFLAVRAKLFTQDIFWKYWQEMPMPRSYEESVVYHETRFTHFFAEQGFAWDSYVETEDLKEVFVNPIMACPRDLLQYRGCPFFKRRSFFTPYADELRRTDGNAAAELEAYLRENTTYPVDALLASLLRTQPLAALAQNLHWQYIVAELSEPENVDLQQQGLCLLHFAPMQADPVVQWYLRKSVTWADAHLQQAVKLFQQYPRLGVLSPSLPLCPGIDHAVRVNWKYAGAGDAVPLDETPPPAPYAGWALIRRQAFPEEVPTAESIQYGWQLSLKAQHSGYYSATFTGALQSAAAAEQLAVYKFASEKPAALARQAARLVKHRLKR